MTAVAIVLLALALLVAVGGAALLHRSSATTDHGAATRGASLPVAALPSVSQLRQQSAAIVETARTAALEARRAALEELSERQRALEATERILEERERDLRTLKQGWEEHRFSLRERRGVVEAELAGIQAQRDGAFQQVAESARLDRDQAMTAILQKVDAELVAEHPDRVERQLEVLAGEPVVAAQERITAAIERQDGSHADGGPRPNPISLEDLDTDHREQLLAALAVVAESTNTDLGVDSERQQASLRGLDPVGREVARQASIEVFERHLQVADIHPLLISTRRSLSSRIAEIGTRAMWEMGLEGRPELAELIGTLHYRFSFGQNALLHCKEAGYLCGVLAAELGMDFVQARRAGMLHDIGKAVDHDVEGSHAIIGGEVLDLFGTPSSLTHAVKAHHFDVEPSTDLALLTISADAISASRPGARRDTLTTYLARLDQLQEIATRHRGVERAFPLQAGREVRISVKPRSVGDADVPVLCAEIAREIEAEMQYPGLIKVTVIRTTTASASSGGGSSDDGGRGGESAGSSAKRKRRRGGRNRGNESGGTMVIESDVEVIPAGEPNQAAEDGAVTMVSAGQPHHQDGDSSGFTDGASGPLA